MKILMVNKFLYQNGGSETYMFQLSEYLEKMGHQVLFFGMEHPENIVNPDYMVQKMDFHTKSLSRFLYPFKVLWSAQAKANIRKAIKAYQPDIVHLNNYHYQLTPSILYECFRQKIPVVQTLHDAILICPNYSLFRVDNMKTCEKCRGGRFYHCMLHRCVHGSMTKSVLAALGSSLYQVLNPYRKINYLISPSYFLSSKMKEMGYRNNNLMVLHNFFSPDKNLAATEKEAYVIYFGRLAKIKGVGTLIEAAKTLGHIRFIIAGRGEDEEEFIKSASPNVEFKGFLTGKELNTLIRNALFSVYPSQWYENCPMSVLESQAVGTPVIGANIGGIPELIQNNVDGLLFESGNVADLCMKISFLYENKSILQGFSVKCIQKVQQFSIDKYYEELIGVYRKAVDQKKARSAKIEHKVQKA
ncbi:MAG: glycosyltransferase [Thermoclostridium sp.]|nr:glycosyltransferase [Thermoclostridium sp.]